MRAIKGMWVRLRSRAGIPTSHPALEIGEGADRAFDNGVARGLAGCAHLQTLQKGAPHCSVTIAIAEEEASAFARANQWLQRSRQLDTAQRRPLDNVECSHEFGSARGGTKAFALRQPDDGSAIPAERHEIGFEHARSPSRCEFDPDVPFAIDSPERYFECVMEPPKPCKQALVVDEVDGSRGCRRKAVVPMQSLVNRRR